MWSSFENPLLAPYSSCGMGSSIELDTNTELHSIIPIRNTDERWYFLFLCDSSLFSPNLSLKLFYTSAKSQLYQMLIHLHAYTQALLWEYGFFKAFIRNLI